MTDAQLQRADEPVTTEEMIMWGPPSRGRPWQPLGVSPRWDGFTAGAIVVLAALANLAVRVPLASAASALVIVGAVVVVWRLRRESGPLASVGAVLAIALGLLLVFRDSWWVTVPAVTAAGAVVLLIAGGGLDMHRRRPWRGTIVGSAQAFHDTAPWVYDGLSGLAPSPDGRRVLVLARAVISASIVVGVLGALLASGDAAVRWLLTLADVGAGLGHFGLTVAMVAPAATVALLAARPRPAEPSDDADPLGRFHTEATASLWAVAAVLAVWCGLQLAIAAGGAEAVLAEQGLTAADYAREGFFQLVAVAAISLAVLNMAYQVISADGRVDAASRLPVLAVGAALVVLVWVSYSRLGYYVDSFGLTMLRLAVATFLGWIAFMTAASVVRCVGVRADVSWLQTATVLSAAVVTIGFGVVNPEAQVARTNLARADVADEIDGSYLARRLGPDAKRVVAAEAWPGGGGRPAEVTVWLCGDVRSAGYGIFGWNWSRSNPPQTGCGS